MSNNKSNINSFPNMDAAQASLFSFIMMNCFKLTFMVMGGPLGISQFVMAVCFARVYFHCNYLFDVVVGMFIGIFFPSMLMKMGLKEIMKGVAVAYFKDVFLGGPSAEPEEEDWGF